QLELDGHFDHDVDGRALPRARREAPAANGGDCALVEPRPEALHDPDVADAAVTAHDNLHDDVAFDAPAASLLAVVGLHLGEQPPSPVPRLSASTSVASIAPARLPSSAGRVATGASTGGSHSAGTGGGGSGGFGGGSAGGVRRSGRGLGRELVPSRFARGAGV